MPRNALTKLATTLFVKIFATLVFWCGPLLLLPTNTLVALGLPESSEPFVRLLGWAYLSLCVGYGFGLRAELSGQRPVAAIWLGIVSNSGASAYLAYFSSTDTWQGAHPWVQLLIWCSAVVAALIAICLAWFGVLRWRPAKQPIP
ncbi:MAG: hypothetical protein DHS20C11_21200 [Lysobacteraceae bacterium]|nr:MAG: hypothetical protein DHS20C11_21200 [Xanthomonadaceae bacterium]